MKTKILILATAAALIGTPVFSAALPHNTTANEIVTVSNDYCGVTQQDIVKYMSRFGITVMQTWADPGTCNAYAKADTGIDYIIYISNGIITGFDETNM